MSNLNYTAYRRVVSNETVDWSNKISVDVPTDVTEVHVDVATNGGTIGGSAVLSMRANDNTGSVYEFYSRLATHTGYNFGNSTDTLMELTTLSSTANAVALGYTVVYPRVTDKYNEIVQEGCEKIGSNRKMATRIYRFLDNVNAITSLQFFTSTSVASSFNLTVRFVR